MRKASKQSDSEQLTKTTGINTMIEATAEIKYNKKLSWLESAISDKTTEVNATSS